MISLFPDKYDSLENIAKHNMPRKKNTSGMMAALAILASVPSQSYAQQKIDYQIPEIDITVACDGRADAVYKNLRGGQSRIALEEGCNLEVLVPKAVSKDGKGTNPLRTTAIIRNEKTGQYVSNPNPISGKSERIFPLEIKTGENGISAGTYNLFIAVESNGTILNSTPIGMYVVANKQPATESTPLPSSPAPEAPDPQSTSQTREKTEEKSNPAPKQNQTAQPQTSQAQTRPNNFIFTSPAYIFGNRESTANNKTSQTTYDGASVRATFGSEVTLLDASVNLTRDKVNERVIGNTTVNNSTTQGNIFAARKVIGSESASLIVTAEATAARHSFAVQGNRTIGFGNGWPFSSSTAISGGAGFVIGKYNEAYVHADARFLWLSQNYGLQNNFISDFITSSVSQTGYVLSAHMMVPLGESRKNFFIGNANKSSSDGLEGTLGTNTTSFNGLLNIALPSASSRVNMGLVLGASYGTYNQTHINQLQSQKQYAIKVGIGISNK